MRMIEVIHKVNACSAFTGFVLLVGALILLVSTVIGIAVIAAFTQTLYMGS